MALSKEFYLDEIRSKYPNSYNESLKDLPVKDLEDMLDFLDQALGKADGGAIGIEVLFTDKKPRKNFFMGGPALEGQALSIYNSMNSYGFTDQEIADALSARGLYTPSGATPGDPITGIINQQIQTSGGGDDNKTGFGKFGNLDPTTERTFVKDVYTIDKNAKPGDPMTGSFKPTEVTGYLNVKTGNYQTLEGKNINHAGIPIKPGIVAVAEALGLGPIDETQFTGLPYKEGYIAGTFTGKNPLDFFKKQQTTIGIQNAAAAEAIRKAEAAERARIENERRSQIGAQLQAASEAGGGYQPTTQKQNISRTSSRVDSSGNVKAYGLADGGRVGLFMGGPALTGQPLAIYNSMNAYGFSDQEIANAIIEAGYELPKKETPTTTTPITNTASNIINQGGRDGPNIDPPTFDKGFSSLNFGLGPNKDVVDYESEAYGIGPTFAGTFARALTALKNIPTPFNIARMGIEKAIEFSRAKKERDRIAAEKAAAELKAKQAIAAAEKKAQEQNILNQAYQQQTQTQKEAGGGPGGQFDGADSKADYDADPTGYSGSFNRGGLATMFTRRR